MSLKLKLISTISAFMLVIGMLFIGVFAATNINVQMGGSLSFNATDVYARVTGEISGAGIGNATLPTLIFDADNETPDTSDWQNLDLEFNAVGDPITLEVKVENLADRNLTVNLQDNFSSEQNMLEKAVKNGDSDYTGSNIVLNASTGEGTSITTFTITLSLSSKNISLSDTTFGYTLNLYDASYEFPAMAAQVTSVSATGATTDTYSGLLGAKAIEETLDLSNIEFANGETTLTISMTSLNANYIKIIVSYNSGAVDYTRTDTSGVRLGATSLYLPQNSSENLTSGESRDLKITVNNTSGSVKTISGLKVSFEEKESLLQADTEEEYWYVEMGTISTSTGSEYIRWRYFSDGESHYTFDSSTAPTGTGYFILETNVLSATGLDGTNRMINVAFNNDYDAAGNGPWYHNQHGLDNVLANDYATSIVRQYINGNNSYVYSEYENGIYTPSGRYSNMYSDLNLDPENDIVYKKIIERSLGDLYTDMTDSETSPTDVAFPDLSNAAEGYQYSESDTDKFWLLSYYEAFTLLSGNATTSTDADREWGSLYWLRSPLSSESLSAYLVFESGYFTIASVDYYDPAARAAFKLSI